MIRTVDHSANQTNYYYKNKIRQNGNVNYSSDREFSFNVSKSYYNFTQRDLTIVGRDGMRFTAKPTPSSNFTPPVNSPEFTGMANTHDFNNKVFNKFVIRKTYYIKYADYEIFKNFIEVTNPNKNSELYILYLEFNSLVMDRKMTGPTTDNYFPGQAYLSITADLVLDIHANNETNEDVYFIDEDIVISFQSMVDASNHPLANGLRNVILDETSYKKSDIFITYDLISNNSAIVLHVNNGGDIFPIKSRRDIALKEGLYKFIYKTNPDGGKHVEVDNKYVPVTQCNELGVYETREKAVSGGNIDESRKERIKELEYETTILKNTYDTEILALKAELERLKKEGVEASIKLNLEADKIKNVSMEEGLVKKDYYEDRSYSRKDTSEAMKYVPGIIGGLAASLVAVKALGITAGVATVAGVGVMKLAGVAAMAASVLILAKSIFSNGSGMGAKVSGFLGGVAGAVAGVARWGGNVVSSVVGGISSFVGGIFSW